MQGKELEGEAEGILCIKQSWPSILRTVYGDHKRFEETYFSAFKVGRVCCTSEGSRLLNEFRQSAASCVGPQAL